MDMTKVPKIHKATNCKLKPISPFFCGPQQQINIRSVQKREDIQKTKEENKEDTKQGKTQPNFSKPEAKKERKKIEVKWGKREDKTLLMKQLSFRLLDS